MVPGIPNRLRIGQRHVWSEKFKGLTNVVTRYVSRPKGWRYDPEYKKFIKWANKSMFVSGGVVVFIGTFEYKFEECIRAVGNPADIQHPHRLFWLRMIYGRWRSRMFGMLMDTHLPVSLRPTVHGAFCLLTGANAEEARYPIDSYQTVRQFFSRNLRDGLRPVEDPGVGGIVTPADGEVVNLVEVTTDRLEQVKGATYKLSSFLGINPMLVKPKNAKLMAAVVYLAPGDYHRFHAPADMTVTHARHYIGECLPVFKGLAKRLNDLFTVNERVVLCGNWSMGTMYYTAVAAYNVGDISLDGDERLRTNTLRAGPMSYCGGDVRKKSWPATRQWSMGDEVGRFNMGSTIVLVFEAPKSFEWAVEPGTKLKQGQVLGTCRPS